MFNRIFYEWVKDDFRNCVVRGLLRSLNMELNDVIKRDVLYCKIVLNVVEVLV